MSLAFQDHYPEKFSHCFGCGKSNPDGLHLKSHWDAEDTIARFTVSPKYSGGVPGNVYGGMVASLLDCHGTASAAAFAYRAAGREMGDDGALDSLRTGVRQNWLAQHPLPDTIHSYSMVALPQAGMVSAILQPGYDQLAAIHPLNDSNVLFYDEIIPGSTLLGYANADHWAIALPVAQSSPTLGATVVNENLYPREVLWQAMIEFIINDLESDRQDKVE